jgi:hypothetical protein
MVPQAKARVAHSEIRQAALRIGGLPVLEDITYPSHGSNQLLLARAIHLAAQAIDVHIDYIGVGLYAHTPDLIEDHRSRDDAASIPAQILQEDELLLGQLQNLSAS